jgi:hypothetical protein
MAKKVKLRSRQIIIFIVVAIIGLAIVVSAVVSQIRSTQPKILFESDFTNPSYNKEPANQRKWGQEDNGETVKLGKTQSNAKNGYDAKESLTVRNVPTQWTKFHDITEPNASFLIRATVMLVKNENPPKPATSFQKVVDPFRTPNHYGFGLILKECKNGQAEKSYKLNVFQALGRNVAPYEIHKLLIRASKNSVSFYIDENEKPAIGEDASRKLKKSFILVDGMTNQCVGFFVDPNLTVAFYDLKAETYLISDVESELRDEIKRLSDKLIDSEETLKELITKSNESLDKKIIATEKLIEGDSRKIAKEKPVAERLYDIENGNVLLKVKVNGLPETNLDNIYREFTGVKDLTDTTFKANLETLIKSR